MRVFKDPTDDFKIDDLGKKQFAPESKKKMRWAVNMYCQWRSNRMSSALCPDQVINSNLDDLSNLSQGSFSYALSRFIVEIRRLDGKEYPPQHIA